MDFPRWISQKARPAAATPRAWRVSAATPTPPTEVPDQVPAWECHEKEHVVIMAVIDSYSHR